MIPDRRPPARPAPELPIEMVVMDIDGTLVGDGLEVGERTRAAAAGAVARGVQVMLATGRMPSSAVVFANQLGLTARLIVRFCNQGRLKAEKFGRAWMIAPARTCGQAST